MMPDPKIESRDLSESAYAVGYRAGQEKMRERCASLCHVWLASQMRTLPIEDQPEKRDLADDIGGSRAPLQMLAGGFTRMDTEYMPNPATITKQEALRRLAEWMGWTLVPGMERLYRTPDGRDRSIDPCTGFNPFGSKRENLYHAFELQANLTDDQRGKYVGILTDQDPDRDYIAWYITNANADQRTRAIVKCVFGCEVEE